MVDSDGVRPFSPMQRMHTFAPIVVPGTSGGDDQTYRIVTGLIPEELRTLLEKPFTEHEREQLFHQVDLLTAEHISAPDRPKALWIFGPPAVGKSTIGDEKACELFGRAGNGVSVDGDDIRQSHDGFQRVVQHGLLHNVVHADAWQLFKNTKIIDELKQDILKRAVENRQNLKLPETALNSEKVRKRLKQLEDADYEMHAICLWAPESETQVRGRARSIKAGKVFTTKFYRQASEGALEFGHLWEKMIKEGSPYYKSVTFFDNSVMPGHPVHVSQFEILMRLTDQEAARHALNCKAAQQVHDTADIVASEAQALAQFPHIVARQWLMNAGQMLRERRQHSDPEEILETVASHLDGLISLMKAEKMRGRMEGLIVGVVLGFICNLVFKRLTPLRLQSR